VIWVEVLSRHHDVVARYRCDDDVRIGRAYDNDVVLDDPYVAPHHLRLARNEDGRLQADDLGTVNGLSVGPRGPRRTSIVLDGSEVLHVGRTLLRIRAPDFAVAAERAATPATRIWPAIGGMTVVVLALAALMIWQGETREPQLSRYVLPMLGVVAVVLVWAMGWAVLSRIFTGVAQFDRHLGIALVGILAFFAFDELSDYGSFAFSSRVLADGEYVGNWLLFAALCFVHLRAIGPRRLAAKAAAVGAVALAAIAAQSVSHFDAASTNGQHSYLQGLKPPMFRMKRAQPLDQFFAESDRLKGALDKARLEPPGGRGWFDSDPDDD